MSDSSLHCIYCGAGNPAGANRCKNCGAPIDIPKPTAVHVTTVSNPSTPPPPTPTTPVYRPETTPQQINDAIDGTPLNQQLKDGLKAAGLGTAALGVGTFFARTAAEATSITIASFLIGFFAAKIPSFGLAALGGILIGLMVGIVVKRPVGALLSAPLGTIIGLLGGGYLLNAVIPAPSITVICAIAGGMLFAVIGGRGNARTGVSKWYGRLRPFLGMAGGFVFALIGYVIG